MAYPSDPRNPADARGRLTPEEADRLAAMFRPSWEVDDAPVTALGAVPGADVRASQGDGARLEARAAVPALNGTHAPAPATAPEPQPESSVIVESSDLVPSSAGAPTPRIPTAHTLVLPDPVGNAGLRRGLSAAIPARTVPFTTARPILNPNETLELAESDFIKPSKKMGPGLWAGIGVAAAAVVGIGVWLGTGSEEKHPAAAPPPEKVHAVAAAIPPAPPPPAETVAASPPPSPVAPAAPPPPTVAPPPATTVAPVAAPPPPQAVAAAPATPPAHVFVPPPVPQRPSWAPPPTKPAAPPPARPKPAGPTIVRDVPF
jgi:hypothetical protein